MRLTLRNTAAAAQQVLSRNTASAWQSNHQTTPLKLKEPTSLNHHLLAALGSGLAFEGTDKLFAFTGMDAPGI